LALYPVVIYLGVLLAAHYDPEAPSVIAWLPKVAENPFYLIWTDKTLLFILGLTVLYGMAVAYYLSVEDKTRRGAEHGSAKWGDPKRFRALFGHKKPLENIILTQNTRLGLDVRKHMRNLNVLVIGGSGAGKTRFYAKPNILQCNASFIVTDPKCELLFSTGEMLKKNGYDVKVFNLIDLAHSDCYNPFHYIRSDTDVLKLITNLIQNTTPKGSKSSDPFWDKSETALLQAFMLYLYHEAPPKEQNFSMVMRMIEDSEVKEDNESHESPIDKVFQALERDKPQHIAVKQYKVFKQAAGKTAKSILISAAVRLAAFNLQAIQEITSRDDMNIASIGEKKTAIFACIPDNDTSFNFLVGMLYSQIFQELYYSADQKHGGRLPIPVHFVLDEFANVSLPNDYTKILSTCRSRNIGISMIVQNIAQIKALFDKEWETLTGNADTLLYLGGNEQGTHEYISKMLGKATIDTNTHGETKGQHGSFSKNFQNAGRELLTPDEVRLLDNKNALLFMRGTEPVIDKKYNLLKHPNIKLTPDGGAQPYRYPPKKIPLFDVKDRIDFSRLEKYKIVDWEDDENDHSVSQRQPQERKKSRSKSTRKETIAYEQKDTGSENAHLRQ